MTTTTHTMEVSESASALGTVTGKRRWKARLIGTGRGSKALYTQEAMSTAAAAFPIGTKVNADHMSWREKDERPEGSITRMIGVIATEPVAEADGAYAEVEFTEEWAPTIEQIAPYVGLSIHSQVYWTEESDEGLPIVTAFLPHPLNTVDVVTVEGAKGKLLEVMESISYDIMDSESNRDRKKMTPEELDNLVSRVVSEVTEALKPAPTPEEEATDEVDVAAVTEAIIAADLPKVARTQVFAAVKNGAVLEEAIKAQQTYIDELSKGFTVEESQGVRKMDTDNRNQMDFSLGAWG